MTSFQLAFLNLTRRKATTVIAVIAIALSVACSGILLRLNVLSQNRFQTMAPGGEALVGAKSGGIDILLGALNGEGDYPGFVPLNLFLTLRSEQTTSFEDGARARVSLRSVIPFLYFAKFQDHRVIATDESFFRRPVTEDAPVFESGAWSEEPNSVILGTDVARLFQMKLGDAIIVQSWVGNSESKKLDLKLKISGILKASGKAWDQSLFSNLATGQGLLSQLDLRGSSIWGANVLNYFLVYLGPGGYLPLATLINERTVGQVVQVSEQKYRLEQLTGTGEKLGFFVTVLVLVMGGLAVTSMLMTRFEAMSMQLAVLRAIGYRKKDIGAWLLWEGFLLGVLACFLGAFLDFCGFPILKVLLSGVFPSSQFIDIPIWQSAPVWIAALLGTIASVFIPLYRAYTQDVHFSLRS